MSATSGRPDAFHALTEQLGVLVELHQRLLDAVRRQRDAVRQADLESLSSVCREEEKLVEKLTQHKFI